MIGKTVARRTYLHVSCLPEADLALEARLTEAEKVAGVSRRVDFNLVRIDPSSSQIALLNYPGFFDDPFPALRDSWRVDLTTGEVGYRTYEDSLNPPILHRKELLLPENHPRCGEYAALTRAAEAIGLFDEPTRIGYRRQWEQLVREKGYRIVGHELLPLGNDETTQDEVGAEKAPSHAGWQASRHLTALVRYGFSAPVQSLARYGFLDGRHSVLDYGCGRCYRRRDCVRESPV